MEVKWNSLNIRNREPTFKFKDIRTDGTSRGAKKGIENYQSLRLMILTFAEFYGDSEIEIFAMDYLTTVSYNFNPTYSDEGARANASRIRQCWEKINKWMNYPTSQQKRYFAWSLYTKWNVKNVIECNDYDNTFFNARENFALGYERGQKV